MSELGSSRANYFAVLRH